MKNIAICEDFLKKCILWPRMGSNRRAHFRVYPFTGSNWISLSQSGHNARFYHLGHFGFPFHPSQNPIVWKKKKN